MMKPVNSSLLLIPLLLFSNNALAEISNCNGKWTNKPCEVAPTRTFDETSDPGNLPVLLKGGSSSEVRPRGNSENDNNRLSSSVPACEESAGGVDIQLLELMPHTTEEEKTVLSNINGTIYNASDVTFTSGVKIYVSEIGARQGVAYKLINDILPPRGRRNFIVELPQKAKNEPRYRTLIIELQHASQKRCYKYHVNLSEGTESLARDPMNVSAPTHARKQSLGKSYEREIFNSLSKLDREIAGIKKRFSRGERQDGSNLALRGELMRLQGSLSKICSQSSFHSSRKLDEKCNYLAYALQEVSK